MVNVALTIKDFECLTIFNNRSFMQHPNAELKGEPRSGESSEQRERL
jgi:hypothetical protein